MGSAQGVANLDAEKQRVEQSFQELQALDYDVLYVRKSVLVEAAKKKEDTESDDAHVLSNFLIEKCPETDDIITHDHYLEFYEVIKAENEEESKKKLDLFQSLISSMWENRIKNVFCTIDINRDGHIVRSELKELVRNFGDVEGAAVTLEKHFDENKDGKITYQEWTSMFEKEKEDDIVAAAGAVRFLEQLVKSLWERRTVAVFNDVDKNKDKALVKSELIALVERSGLGNTESVAQAIIEYCDVNHDGEISIEEWTGMFLREIAEDPKIALDTLSFFEELVKDKAVKENAENSVESEV